MRFAPAFDRTEAVPNILYPATGFHGDGRASLARRRRFQTLGLRSASEWTRLSRRVLCVSDLFYGGQVILLRMATRSCAACNGRRTHTDCIYCEIALLIICWVLRGRRVGRFLLSCLGSSPQRREVLVYCRVTLLEESFSSLGTFHPLYSDRSSRGKDE